MIYADATDDLNSVIDGAGPLAGLFFVLLGIAVFIIWKSMNKQMKKIDSNLPPGRADLRRQADAKYTEEAEVRGEEEAAATTTEDPTPADG
ncbi:MAG: hypothetical protein RL205_1662 [Actinomycetota bacterium]|jgi:hypothetical protein